MSLANMSGGLICLLISPDHPTTVGTVWKVALNLDIDRFTVSAHRLSFISVSGILGQTKLIFQTTHSKGCLSKLQLK